ESSKLGARIRNDGVPLSNTLKEFCQSARIDPLRYALGGGEDYELLFTLDPRALDRLMRQWPDMFEIPLTHIGEMDERVEGIRIVAANGRERPLDARSFEHFRK
ncbi:MAG: thiamine-phosphate kinase, partial [Candidatus Lindowbacteria bacterium]|nr:thiamine-phosphate kinase [Candidatus Lindowbacteria bacterium]